MKHDEHNPLDDLVLHEMPETAHLSAEQKQTLLEYRAIRARLRSAGLGIHADSRLRANVQRRLAREESQRFSFVRHSRRLRARWRTAASLAAAAVLLFAVGLWFAGTGPAPVYAQDDLASIHTAAKQNDYMKCCDPGELCQTMSRACGQTVRVPALSSSCALLGGKLAKFRGRTVAAFLLQYHDRRVTVLQLDMPISSLGFRHLTRNDRVAWARCGFQTCAMMALQAPGAPTFVAVGELPHEQLRTVLMPFLYSH